MKFTAKSRKDIGPLLIDRGVRPLFAISSTVSCLALLLIMVFLLKEGLPFFAQNEESLRIYRLSGLEYADKLRSLEDEHTSLVRQLGEIRAAAFSPETPAADSAAFDNFASALDNAAEPLRTQVGQLTDIALANKEKLTAYAAALATPAPALAPPTPVPEPAPASDTPAAPAAPAAATPATSATTIAAPAAATVIPANPACASSTTDKSVCAATIAGTPPVWAHGASAPLLMAKAAMPRSGVQPVSRSSAATPPLPVLDSVSNSPAALAVPAALDSLSKGIESALANIPRLPSAALDKRLRAVAEAARRHIATYPEVFRELAAFNAAAPIPWWKAPVAFFFGSEWRTASFLQDWYGIRPLFIGSLLVSAIALSLAIPLGVAAAIHVNQLASAREKRIVKPLIEGIAAIPSVVLGFFGITILGDSLRVLSQAEWLNWVPGFPVAERLNALTAGCLLGLVAVPAIFTLAEDALDNVPASCKEASEALGASRLQTIGRVLVPAALPGILTAVLLGLGRVVGETMIVLLCAGNRIAIPDFSTGPAVVTQPVHTMTGIIAQEMGEVVHGGIHYRALFSVGLFLLFFSLLINAIVQKTALKHVQPRV